MSITAAALVVVQGGGGLVGEHDLGIVQQRAGNGSTLLFAHAEFMWTCPGAVTDAQAVEHVVHLGCESLGDTAGGQLVGQGQILAHSQALHKVRLLEDDAHFGASPTVQFPVGAGVQRFGPHRQGASGRGQQPTKQVKQGGFAGPAVAQQEHSVPLGT